MSNILRPIILVLATFYFMPIHANNGLRVFTSGNADSNAVHSFVVVPNKAQIPEGITSQAKKGFLKKQLPFKIEILDEIDDVHQVQWKVTIRHNDFGRIRVKSDYSGKKVVRSESTTWTSFRLNKKTPDRHILVFEPRAQKHKSAIYKKGKPLPSKGVSSGGGTESIAVTGRNPRLAYQVEAAIINSAGKTIQRYSTSMVMDNKDLIRQEYINHYGIPRATAGAAGDLPVPTRTDIKTIPSKPLGYDGLPLTESEYELIIEDGAVKLAAEILKTFEHMKHYYRQPGNELKDLNDKIVTIPNSKLWLSSGWRNPERNEWFSDALNGAHQLGAAIDLMPNEIPRKKNAAIVYWVLWESIKSIPDQHRIFAQLEALALPMRDSSFLIDIEPRNGIPDAFDTADHLHINLVNE
jgi:hypothetical protein